MQSIKIISLEITPKWAALKTKKKVNKVLVGVTLSFSSRILNQDFKGSGLKF